MKKILLCLLIICFSQASRGNENVRNQSQSVGKKKQHALVLSKKRYPIKNITSNNNNVNINHTNNNIHTKNNNIIHTKNNNIIHTKITPKITPKPMHAIVKKTATHQNLSDQLDGFSVLAVDANTGKILFSKNADETRYPASLTKLMTLYMMFDLLDRNRLSLNDKIRFSQNAASKPRSKLGVQCGDYITVKEAINALIVLSANDVASAVAEHISGSELEFAKMMTRKARSLKMYKTNFYNPSGLFHPSQKTTASDMIKLGIGLKQNFPQYYKYFLRTSFNFRGKDISGHNRITANYPGAEGLKTGYISQSGYNLISSASRDQKTVFATVLGGKTSRERDVYMEKLLDASFTKASRKVRL